MTVALPPILPGYPGGGASILSIAPDELDALQSDLLRRMAGYVYQASPFWRAKMVALGVRPADIRSRDDVALLPTCTKQELQQDQLENPPFGRYTCSPATTWRQYFRTSGTTGRPVQRVFSRRDWDIAIDLVSMTLDVRPGDRFLILPPVDSLLGPTGAADAVRRGGGLPVLAGMWSTDRRLEALAELRPAGVMGAASYLLHLSEVAAGRGMDLGACGVRLLWSIGEPGAAIPGTSALLAARFGGARLVDGYGMTELMPLASSCPHRSWLHLKEHAVLVECLDPATDTPVAEGALGHLVLTNLVGDTQPLLRYRTGDLARLTARVPCECGHTHAKIAASIEGRVDDMVWYRGVNVFPMAIEQVLRGFRELGAEYEIVVDHRPSLAAVTVRAETSAAPGPAGEALRERIGAQLKSRLGVSLDVELLAPDALRPPTGAGKIRRVRRIGGPT